MPSEAQRAVLTTYAQEIRTARRAHRSITEPGLAPRFQRLLQDLLPTLPNAPALTVVPEFHNPGIGRPDIALKRPGEVARAYVELKALDKPADGTRWRDPHDRRQFQRFGELAHWATSNFHELRLYERSVSVGHAVIVPEAALDPDRADGAADALVSAHDADPALRLLGRNLINR